MHALPLVLLRDRAAFWEALEARRLGWGDLIRLLAFVVAVCAMYGAVLAGWRSPRLSAYVAVKLPLLFLGTMGVVSVFNWMLASVLGSGLSFRQTLFSVAAAMGVGCWFLLAFVPLALFFLLTGVPAEGPHDTLRYAHNAMLMTHIVLLALAGVAGNAALLGGLRKVVRPGCPVGGLFALWLAAYAFVGCQLSWVLRPFVGSPFYPVAFLRPDRFDRNFYEFIFTEVLPFLATGNP